MVPPSLEVASSKRFVATSFFSAYPIDRVNLPGSPRWAARSNVSRTPHSIRVGGHGFPPPRAKRILSARDSRRLAGPKGNDHFVRVGALNQLPVAGESLASGMESPWDRDFPPMLLPSRRHAGGAMVLNKRRLLCFSGT
jgi:hypothetical protein